MILRIVLTLAAVVAGCDRPGRGTGQTAAPSGGARSVPAPVVAPAPPAAPASAAAPAAAAPTAAVTSDAGAADDSLVTEPREADPRSETVRIKIGISPASSAGVYWGRKKLGETRAGHPSVDIDRPRGTGPLDLVIRAEGFLPHHVRVFTDRDDRISVRLVRPADAPGLLGYRPAPSAPVMTP